MTIKPPYPYFGGKTTVAPEIWRRLGDCYNFVDPFFGGGSLLLLRTHWNWGLNDWRNDTTRLETVNDIDCYLSNFWRSIQFDPEETAYWADWPVNEADLHARHLWLINQDEFRETMKTDPDYYDPQVAGWWVWGISQWIGGEWCKSPSAKRPHLLQPRGVHRRRPHLLGTMGVHRQLPHLYRPGRGTHRKRPHLSGPGMGIHTKSTHPIYDYFAALQGRLKRVRVCCGDWSRVLGPSVTHIVGLTGIVLDPPYSHSAGRTTTIYANDNDVSDDVRAWAIANGDNPLLRIALCGYDTEHDMPESWEVFSWQTQGGYGNQSNGQGLANKGRETIWFSPHCLKVSKYQQSALF